MEKPQSKQTYPWGEIWIRPKQAMRKILQRLPSSLVLWLAILGGVVTALSWMGVIWLQAPHRHDVRQITFVVAFLVVGALLGLFHLYFGGWLYKVTGSWIGGKGSFQEVKAAVGWANYPFIVAGVCNILNTVFFSVPPIRILFAILSLVLTIWGLVLFFNLLGESHRFSAWRALGAVCLAVVLVFAALVILSLLLPLLHPLFVA